MTSRPPGFSAWLREQYRPGATYDVRPVAALTADVGGRAGRFPRTPAALVVLLRQHGATPGVYAAAGLAAAQYLKAVLTFKATAEAEAGHRTALPDFTNF